jgi:hypothetical protein
VTLDCIVCDKPLEAAVPDPVQTGVNQPYAGTSFHSYGHYGSTIFDPMDGQFIEINVCDECLERKRGREQNVIALGRTHKNLREDPTSAYVITGYRELERSEVPPIVPWYGQEEALAELEFRREAKRRRKTHPLWQNDPKPLIDEELESFRLALGNHKLPDTGSGEDEGTQDMGGIAHDPDAPETDGGSEDTAGAVATATESEEEDAE